MKRILGNTALVLLVGVVLRLWHLLLLRQSLDRPLVVAGWLALAFVLAVASWRAALGIATERRHAHERWLARADGAGVAFVAFFLCLLFLFFSRHQFSRFYFRYMRSRFF